MINGEGFLNCSGDDAGIADGDENFVGSVGIRVILTL